MCFFLFDVVKSSKFDTICQEKIAIYDNKGIFSDPLCKLYNFLHKSQIKSEKSFCDMLFIRKENSNTTEIDLEVDQIREENGMLL